MGVLPTVSSARFRMIQMLIVFLTVHSGFRHKRTWLTIPRIFRVSEPDWFFWAPPYLLWFMVVWLGPDVHVPQEASKPTCDTDTAGPCGPCDKITAGISFNLPKAYVKIGEKANTFFSLFFPLFSLPFSTFQRVYRAQDGKAAAVMSCNIIKQPSTHQSFYFFEASPISHCKT